MTKNPCNVISACCANSNLIRFCWNTMLNRASLFVTSILSICKGFEVVFLSHGMVLGRVRLLSHSQGPMELRHMCYMGAIWGLRALDRLLRLWRPYNWPEEWLNERTTFQYIFNGGITSLRSFPSWFKAFSKRLPKPSIVEHSAVFQPVWQ